MKAATKRRYWKPWEEQFLREHYADKHTHAIAVALDREPKQIHSKAIALGLHKSRELIAAMARDASRRPDHGGRAHQFAPGLTPWNKGATFVAGGRSAETRFKPGSKPHTWVPIGSYRIVINKNGGPQLERKVNDNPGPTSVRWTPVHRLVWEAAHGPVPDGHIVVFKPGMRTTEPDEITVDRLECITRQQLMQRNTIHNLPPEFAEVARLKAVLHRAINTRNRKEGRATEPAEA